MPRPILLLAMSPQGEARLARAFASIRARETQPNYILLTTRSGGQRPVDGIETVWCDADKRGASAFLALMRRLSWQDFEVVYDFEASFLTRFMRFCLWPRPKWHVWPFLTCGNRASNL